MSNTNVKFYDTEFSSRLLIGTALYPSPAIMQQAIRASRRADRHRLGAPRDRRRQDAATRSGR